MNAFSIRDHKAMARALMLARRGMTTAHPNPRVGCVLMKNDDIVGEGWHQVAGSAHAEIVALEAAGSNANGATAYVTLEPCAHDGRTGPCTKALIDAGIAKVIAAMQDPYPEVAGRGFEALRSAGIGVESGLMESAARTLNEGYLSRVLQKRPFVTLKVALSADGATAMADGESQWITGEAARRDVQRLRARSGAILTGVNTVVADDPLLTVRDAGMVLHQPLRVVIDSHLKTPVGSRLLGADGETLIFCTNDTGSEPLREAGADVVRVAAKSGRVALEDALAMLASRHINNVLAECGPTLAGALLDASLVDELVIYQAPHIMGSETQRMAATPAWKKLADRLPLTITDRRQVGPDSRITARPVYPQTNRET